MLNNIDDVAKDLLNKEVARVHRELDDLYDKAEGISAKVKLWIKMNKVRLIVDAGLAILFFIAGLAC